VGILLLKFLISQSEDLKIFIFIQKINIVKMNRILFISHDASIGGAQNLLINIITWLKNNRNIIPVIYLLSVGSGALYEKFSSLGNVYKGEEKEIFKTVKIIYGNTCLCGKIYGEILSINPNVKIITHFHELQISINAYAKDCIHDTINKSHHFIACSDSVKENLMKTYNIKEEKISLVYASIIPKYFEYSDNNNKKIRDKYIYGMEDKFCIVGSGIGLAYRKGVDIFIRISNMLKSDKFQFIWIGDFNKDEKINDFTFDEIKKNSNVKFLGFNDSPQEILKACDVFLLTSREDPFPLICLEAAEVCLPLLCFEGTGGMVNFIKKSGCGFVSPNMNQYGDFALSHMADKILYLHEKQNERRQMGIKAREYLLQNFTIDITTPQIANLLKSFETKDSDSCFEGILKSFETKDSDSCFEGILKSFPFENILQDISSKIPDKEKKHKEKKENKLVTIILPNYNYERYLRERLESINKQTYKNWRMIVLDDASTDNSEEIILKFIDENKDKNIHLVKNEKNSGNVFQQWIKGLKHYNLTEKDIIWIAEADDVSDIQFLENSIPYFDDENVKIVYCDSHVIDSNGKIIGDYLNTNYLMELSKNKWNQSYIISGKEEILEALGIKNTILNASSMLFKYFDISTIEKSLVNMKMAGDWFFIISALTQNPNDKIAYSNKRYNYHRRHIASVFGNNESKEKREEKYKTLFGEIQQVHKLVRNKVELNWNYYEKIFKYLKQQYQDLNLEKPINYFYPIKLGIMQLKEFDLKTTKNAGEIMQRTGNNTGNLIFSKAGKELIFSEFCDLKEDCDIIYLIASNWLNESIDLEWLYKIILQKKVPCICIGLGAQANNEDTIPKLKEGTIKCIREISKRTPFILVRGEYTKKVCEFYDIKNVKIGGCCSIFSNPDPELGLKLEAKYKKLKYSNMDKIIYNYDLNMDKLNLFNFDKTGKYILQNESYLMDCKLNLFNRDGNCDAYIKKLNLTEKETQQLIENISFFTEVEKWSQYVKEFDVSLGNRIHGTIICLENEVPVICFPHDTRVRELCETLKIPVNIEEAKNFNGLDFDNNRKKLTHIYKELFQQFNLTSSLEKI
jgi:glycosyltransferase involved in cell wall biosynthesis